MMTKGERKVKYSFGLENSVDRASSHCWRLFSGKQFCRADEEPAAPRARAALSDGVVPYGGPDQDPARLPRVCRQPQTLSRCQRAPDRRQASS